MKRLLILLLFIVGLVSHSQTVEYELVYNNSTGNYEAYAQVTGVNPSPLALSGNSGFTIVLPASFDDAIIASTGVSPLSSSIWSNNSNIYAPTVTPTLDYRRFSLTTPGPQYTSFTDGDRILLFTFSLGTCVPDIRLWDNTTDPDSGDPGMAGLQLDNSFVVNNPLLNRYSGNIDPSFVYVQDTSGPWETASNWAGGRVPPENANNVRINAGVASTVNASHAVFNLETGAGSTVTVDNGLTLNVGGDLTNAGNFDGDGYVVMDGTCGAQRIIGDNVDDTNFQSFTNLRTENLDGVTMEDDHDITGVLDIDGGDFTVDTNEFFTFRSSASNTAVVDEVASTSTVSGCFVIERYIPGNRDFRYLASPVNTNSGSCGKPSISDNLQEGQQIVNRFDYATQTIGTGPNEANPDFGTHITGSQTTTASDMATSGFDATQTGDPSMFRFSNPSQTWSGIGNTDTDPLTVGDPFAIMIRGGRDMDLNISNTEVGNETILRFTGQIVTGPQSALVLNTGASAYNFVANPYQAQVNIGTLIKNETTGIINNTAIVYEPAPGGTFGNYVTLEFDGTTGNVVTKTPATANATNFLQPNQSFFVQNVASPSSVDLTFRESYKSNSTMTTAVFSETPSSDVIVAIDLYNNDTNTLRDGVNVRMGTAYSNSRIDGEDVLKISDNFDETLAAVLNGENLAIDKRLASDAPEIVQLYSNGLQSSNYQFKIFVENPENKEVYLVDNYLGTNTLLDNNYIEYNFNSDENLPSSVDINRFQLNFTNTTLSDTNFELSGIVVYPNPMTDSVTVGLGQFNGQAHGLQLFDITGKLVKSMDVNNALEINVDVNALSSGVYILQLNTDKGQYQEKLIKN